MVPSQPVVVTMRVKERVGRGGGALGIIARPVIVLVNELTKQRKEPASLAHSLGIVAIMHGLTN